MTKDKFRWPKDWPEKAQDRGIEAMRFYVGARGELRAKPAAKAFKAPRLVIRGKSGKQLSPRFVKLVKGYMEQSGKKKESQSSIDKRTVEVHIEEGEPSLPTTEKPFPQE